MNQALTTRRVSTVRRIGWLSVASMLALALLGPGAGSALATNVNPTTHEGNITTCPPQYTTVSIDGSASIGTAGGVTVTVTYNVDNSLDFSASGGLVYIAYIKGGSAYNEYDYVSSPVAADTGLVAPPVGQGNTPGVSHSVFCVTQTTTSTTTTETTGTTTTETTGTTTTETTGTTTTQTTGTTTTQTTGTTTTQTTGTTTTQTTGTTTTQTTGTTTTQTTGTTTTQAFTSSVLAETGQPSFSQAVLGETGAPNVTLPPTDSLAGAAAPSSDSWRMFLIVMAALLASALLMTPARVTNRRR